MSSCGDFLESLSQVLEKKKKFLFVFVLFFMLKAQNYENEFLISVRPGFQPCVETKHIFTCAMELKISVIGVFRRYMNQATLNLKT